MNVRNPHSEMHIRVSCTLRIACLALAIIGCRPQTHDETYTLYRNSVLKESARYHIATFDADSTNGIDYNRSNCEIARDLFQNQPGVETRFWCEKGRYRE